MKNVQNILILALFILGSLSVVGQNPERIKIILENQAKGNAILKQFNVASPCFTYTETPEGIYIGVRSETNSPQYFLYAKGEISRPTKWDNIVIHAYSMVTNELIISPHKPVDHYNSFDVVAYNLNSKKERVLLETHEPIVHIDVNYDTIMCYLKNSGLTKLR